MRRPTKPSPEDRSSSVEPSRGQKYKSDGYSAPQRGHAFGGEPTSSPVAVTCGVLPASALVTTWLGGVSAACGASGSGVGGRRGFTIRVTPREYCSVESLPYPSGCRRNATSRPLAASRAK